MQARQHFVVIEDSVVIEGDEDLEKYSGGPIILHLADNRPVQIVITSRTKRTPPTYKVRQ